jgi:hypothetical protein
LHYFGLSETGLFGVFAGSAFIEEGAVGKVSGDNFPRRVRELLHFSEDCKADCFLAMRGGVREGSI